MVNTGSVPAGASMRACSATRPSSASPAAGKAVRAWVVIGQRLRIALPIDSCSPGREGPARRASSTSAGPAGWRGRRPGSHPARPTPLAGRTRRARPRPGWRRSRPGAVPRARTAPTGSSSRPASPPPASSPPGPSPHEPTPSPASRPASARQATAATLTGQARRRRLTITSISSTTGHSQTKMHKPMRHGWPASDQEAAGLSFSTAAGTRRQCGSPGFPRRRSLPAPRFR